MGVPTVNFEITTEAKQHKTQEVITLKNLIGHNTQEELTFDLESVETIDFLTDHTTFLTESVSSSFNKTKRRSASLDQCNMNKNDSNIQEHEIFTKSSSFLKNEHCSSKPSDDHPDATIQCGLLPPLPNGSQVFQNAMKEFSPSQDHSDSTLVSDKDGKVNIDINCLISCNVN